MKQEKKNLLVPMLSGYDLTHEKKSEKNHHHATQYTGQTSGYLMEEKFFFRTTYLKRIINDANAMMEKTQSI